CVRRKQKISGRKNQQGVIITLVAVFMLFVIGAMAALSIDVVTLYTARSEAQLAADSAALAGARVLANSGATSDTSDASMPGAWTLAQAVALQVAEQNQVGGVNLTPSSQVTISTTLGGGTNANSNPTVTVTVQKTDLPTFFSRIWGRTQLTVSASATAEVYNPSNIAGAPTNAGPPVAPICVKPWLLSNMDPISGTAIFAKDAGAIMDPTLLGTSWSIQTNPNIGSLMPVAGQYF